MTSEDIKHQFIIITNLQQCKVVTLAKAAYKAVKLAKAACKAVKLAKAA